MPADTDYAARNRASKVQALVGALDAARRQADPPTPWADVAAALDRWKPANWKSLCKAANRPDQKAPSAETQAAVRAAVQAFVTADSAGAEFRALPS